MSLTPEQLKQRKNGIGGSDAAAICGLSSYKTPYGVYLEKIGEVVEELDESNPRIEWGKRLEHVIAEYFEEKNNVKLTERDTRWHPNHPFMFANIDRFIECKNAILEIKTTDKFLSSKWGEEESDKIPIDYLLQCCHYAAVYDVERVYIIVLIGGNEPRQYLYERDKELEDKLIQKEKTFWEEHVLKKIPPAAMTFQDVLHKYPSSMPDIKATATEAIEEKIEQMRKFQEEIKSYTEKANQLKIEIQDFMGQAEMIVDSEGNPLVSWKSSKDRAKFSVKAFKEKHKELYGQFLETTKGSRMFLLKRNKNEVNK